MKNIASMFSEKAREALDKHLHIELSDEHDYTESELGELFDYITDEFPYSYGEDGKPRSLGSIFESIIDVFHEHKLVTFNK